MTAEPITDVSLLALFDADAVAAVATAVEAAAPDLGDGLIADAVEQPGLHVTLHEFVVTRGHQVLPAARRWCEKAGGELVERVAALGPARLRGSGIVRSARGAAIILDLARPGDWLERLCRTCRAFDGPSFLERGRQPDRLHLTIARTHAPESEVANAVTAVYPLDLVLEPSSVCLALATALPYGQVRWLHARPSSGQ